MVRIILTLFLFPTILFAQKKVYVDDVYSTAPATDLELTNDTLPERRWFIKNYEEGEVFFSDGSSNKGFIKFNGGLTFKKNITDKQKKYAYEAIEYFTVGNETYVIAKDFNYQAQRMWGNMKRDIGYLKKITDGRASIYFNEVKAATGTPGVYTTTINYYIKLDTNNNYVFLPPNKKKFVELMSHLFEGDSEVIETISHKNFKPSLTSLKEVVNGYNSKFAAAKKL